MSLPPIPSVTSRGPAVEPVELRRIRPVGVDLLRLGHVLGLSPATAGVAKDRVAHIGGDQMGVVVVRPQAAGRIGLLHGNDGPRREGVAERHVVGRRLAGRQPEHRGRRRGTESAQAEPA